MNNMDSLPHFSRLYTGNAFEGPHRRRLSLIGCVVRWLRVLQHWLTA